MTAAQSFRQFKGCLTERLGSLGFVGRGDTVWHKVHDTIVVIEVQKDRKYTTKDEVRFTINLGISVDALRDAGSTTGGPSFSENPLPEKCQWRERLGHLLPAQTDVWWSVRDEK